jgi:protein disulfide-isomerase A1
MHTVRNFAFGLLAAAAVASASDVEQLKKDNFDEFIKSNDIVLAECTSTIDASNQVLP